MKLISPVTDRTLSDVLNRTAKGFINTDDWIRIYRNSQFVSLVISILLDTDIDFDELTEPTTTSFPTVDDLNTLLANIQRAKDASGLPDGIGGLVDVKTDWTAGVSSVSPNYVDANAWEQTELMILESLPASLGFMIYAGVSNSGQARFWQNRFRLSAEFVETVPLVQRRGRTGKAKTGTGLTRQNYFRGFEFAVRKTRIGVSTTGAGITRQNSFRRYA